VSMQLDTLENYICWPHTNKPGYVFVAELEVSDMLTQPGFVSIPYLNPQNEKIKINYFKLNQRFELAINKNNMPNETLQLIAKTPKEQYLDNVKKIKEHIQLGNIYEINYCIEFFSEGKIINPFDTFIRLAEITKAPYSFLLKLGDDFVICCSPELFLSKKENQLFSKPIKGTIKRGKTKNEDEFLKDSLYQSKKERTENVMAVDVARNDLSKIAKKGSVSVNKLYNIESFETVHQMVSTVSCEINNNVTFEEMIEATFPMASMTGAPKIKAMQLIDEFENFERNNYSSCFGLIDQNGDFEMPVVIRSIFYNQQTKKLSVAAGGAITYLSEPEKEYEEILLKITAQLKSLNATIKN